MSNNPLGALDPNEIFDRLVNLGEEWAEANAAASLYEETQKTMLAQIANRYQGSMSVAAAEKVALGSDEYQRHVRNMVLARRDANRKRVRYDSAKVWAELLRSANANRRAEMSLAGMQT